MRYPRAIWKPVTRYDVGGANHVPMAAFRRLVLHTAVFDGDSLFDLFNISGNPVAHFYVREDGTVEQYVDTGIRASAVLDGNPDSITVESWDGYPTHFKAGQPPKWTPAQVDALVNLARWCNEVHGIPLQQLPNSRPGTQGVGWHRQGCDGNFPTEGILAGRVAGGESWSPSFGKGCPGDNRIQQVVNEIIPRAKDGDDMALNDQVNDEHTVKQVLNRLDRFIDNSVSRDQQMLAALDEIQSDLNDLPPDKQDRILARLAKIRAALTEETT